MQCCRWPPGAIYVRTGKRAYTMDSDGMQEGDAYSNGDVKISIITYGILWRWLTEHDPGSSPIQRYVAILLDEFTDLAPVTEEAARILAS